MRAGQLRIELRGRADVRRVVAGVALALGLVQFPAVGQTQVVEWALLPGGTSDDQVSRVDTNAAGNGHLTDRFRTTSPFRTESAKVYAGPPLTFIPNVDQAQPSVRFVGRGAGFTGYFAADEVTLSFALPQTNTRASSEPNARAHNAKSASSQLALTLRFLDANPEVEVVGRSEVTGKVNYLLGNDASKWRTGLSMYREVVYRGLWLGVDMIFRRGNERLKYELVVRPGARLEDIRLAFDGADSLSVDEAGRLVISTPLGIIRDERPESYQEIDGKRVPLDSRFVVERSADGEYVFGFFAEDYDPRYAVVIDPTVIYSTFLGGDARDRTHLILLADGGLYVAGYTESNASTFPPIGTPFQGDSAGGRDVFLLKLSEDGTDVEFITYLGGSGDDIPTGMAWHPSGNIVLVGRTVSDDFPISPPVSGQWVPFQDTRAGGDDAFVVLISPDGERLEYGTYFGGSSHDWASGATIGPSGAIYFGGMTRSADFPVGSPSGSAFDETHNGGTFDTFVTMLDINDRTAPVIASTYLGGPGWDTVAHVAVNGLGDVYAGSSCREGVNDVPQNIIGFRGGTDAYVAKLTSDLSTVTAFTYIGGSRGDGLYGLTIDASGALLGNGGTTSNDFPTTPNAFDTLGSTTPTLLDGFAIKLSPDLTQLDGGTYLGGNARDFANGIATDAAGNVYVSGITDSTNFPTTLDAFQDTNMGSRDLFLTVLTPDWSTLLYSTYLGGSQFDWGGGLILDCRGAIYLPAWTASSTDFPIVNAYDSSFGGGDNDAVVVKMSPLAPPPDDCNLNCEPDASEGDTQKTFKVVCSSNPCSNGSNWSFLLDWQGNGPNFENLSCGPVLGAGTNAADMADAFVNCINTTVCPSINAVHLGRSPIFQVSVPGTGPFRLCVGSPDPPGPDCCVGSGNVCSFNPELVEVVLSGKDCNRNGIDDAIDIALETSQDDNENGIPDECADIFPTVSEWGLVLMTLLLLTGIKVKFGRRKQADA